MTMKSSDYYSGISHPYGVKPTGNSFMESNTSLLYVRSKGLGKLYILTDSNIIDILSYLSYHSLCHISLSSRALYVFSNHSDLWRDLFLYQWKGNNINYYNTWRDTYSYNHLNSINKLNQFKCHQPLVINGIYSDFLHRPWACSSFDILTACPGILTNNDIDTIDYNNLSIENFINNYEIKNIPIVIRNAIKHWPAYNDWNNNYLIDQCKDNKFRATSPTAPLSAEFTMKQYINYILNTKEEAPFYLFERDYIIKFPNILNDYEIPKYFSSTHIPTTDLFRVLGDDRPDHHWLIVGPANSGSIFHIDPNQTNAWNACVKGRKKWIFYPPNVTPPGIETSRDGGDVTIPISIGEWLLTFWKFHQKCRNDSDLSKRPLETIVYPGDAIFVPHNYWHMVINLDDCIALTYNYVSTSNLTNCLAFLREKTNQISGIRDRIYSNPNIVKPEELYNEFINKLSTVLPQSIINEAIANSYTNKKNYICNIKSSKRKKIKDQNIDSNTNSFTFDFNLNN